MDDQPACPYTLRIPTGLSRGYLKVPCMHPSSHLLTLEPTGEHQGRINAESQRSLSPGWGPVEGGVLISWSHPM